MPTLLPQKIINVKQESCGNQEVKVVPNFSSELVTAPELRLLKLWLALMAAKM